MAVAEPQPAPPPPTAEPPDEWRARDRAEREVLKGLRRVGFKAGRSRIVVIHWNGVMAIVLPTEQA